MKKILVLFTGGTIGSCSSNGVINVDDNQKYMLIEQYQSIYGKEITFECNQILNILSENITSTEWEIIADELNNIDFNSYSGIIITHGSDTLAYTSAFIGMLFRHTPIPIVITAANMPLNEKGTNGLYNFTCAVKFICDNKHNGIFTVYEDIFCPTRMLPADTCLDKFSSYGGDSFYRISNKMLDKTYEPILKNPLKLTRKVLKIHGYPDMDFSAYSISKNIGAVLYVPYHSGTASMCEDNKNQSFEYLSNLCENENIPLYICGIKNSDKYYDTLVKMMNSGAKTIGKISDVSAYMKLLIGINQTEYTLDEFMNTNIYFENIL